MKTSPSPGTAPVKTSKRVQSGRKNVKIYNKGLIKLTSGIFQDKIKGKIKFIQDIKNE